MGYSSKTETSSSPCRFKKDTQAVEHVLQGFLVSEEARLHQFMDVVHLHAVHQGSAIWIQGSTILAQTELKVEWRTYGAHASASSHTDTQTRDYKS